MQEPPKHKVVQTTEGAKIEFSKNTLFDTNMNFCFFTITKERRKKIPKKPIVSICTN